MPRSGLTIKVGLLLAALAWSGCQRSAQRVIAVVPKGTAHVFWQTVHAGAAAAGRDLGIAIEWNGPALETDYSKQIEIVENFLTRRVDGILLAPQERKALVGVIEKAQRARIPLVVFDSGADTEAYVSFVATDNYLGGQLAARRMGEILNGKGKVAVIATAPGSASTLDRERGFQDALKEFPALRVVALQYGMSDRARSMAVTEDILTANPGLDGLFASNESSAVGAAQALKSRQLNGKVKLVGFDTSTGLIEDLQSGTIDSLVVQNPYRMGYEGVKTLVDHLAGRTPPKRIDSGVTLVRREDLGKPEIQKLVRPVTKVE
jgi:ribose transport system substrate-binding protein